MVSSIIPNQCIIIGGGNSIKNVNIDVLKTFCSSKFTILINYAFKYFDGTFLVFQDREFYVPAYAKHYPDQKTIRHPDIYEELKSLPLIIGINDNGIEEFKLNNTILLDKNEKTDITGIFALKLAAKIIEKGTIYLLGFDWTCRTGLPERDPHYSPNSNLQIHYYGDIKHRGIGYVGYYENHSPDAAFKHFQEPKLKIYNVSLNSNINTFEKISYEQMFNLLSRETINQNELRQAIKEKLCIR